MNSDHVTAPRVGQINVVNISTSTTAAQDSAVSSLRQFITILADQDFYVTFGNAATVTDPDETATSGNGRTYGPIAAKVEFHRELTSEERFFKIKAVGTGKARWYLSSPKE